MEYIGWLEDDELLKVKEEIVIYGAGKYGQRVYMSLKEKGLAEKVKAFCVSDEAASGGEVEGVKVVSVKVAAEKFPEACFLIASVAVRQMVEELREVGIAESIHVVKA